VIWSCVKRSVRRPARARSWSHLAVALERRAGAVVAPAVGLDHEPRAGEHEASLLALDVLVDARPRQAARTTQREEPPLDAGSRERGAGGVVAQGCPQFAGSAVVGVSSRDGIEGGDVRAPRVLRLVEEALDGTSVQRGGEVEDRARRSRHGDAVVDGRLPGEAARAVDRRINAD
jgi:hypothetical protein